MDWNDPNEEDDEANELNYLRAMRENGEQLSEDDLLMLGIIEE